VELLKKEVMGCPGERSHAGVVSKVVA